MSRKRKVYEVDVTRDGRFWTVHVPDVDRVTQARSLPEVHTMATDLIGIMEDLDPREVMIDVVVKVPTRILDQVELSQRLRGEAADAQARGAAAFRSAVRALVIEEGVTVRDVGSLFGISHQRVHQLVHDTTPTAPRKAPDRKPETQEEVRLVAAG